MECVPKLFPMWHELGYKSIMKHKNFRFANSKLPDYGGMGIDMILDGAEIKWNVLKHTVDQTGFKANLCALPFIPANKVETLDDPCLEPVKEKKANIKKFCIKLESLRKSVNSRGKERYKDEILSLYKKIKKMSNLGQFEKILIPEYIVQLANEIPEQVFCPDINFSYAGGCLTTSKRLDNKYVLLYSTGRKFDRLAMTTLEENHEPYKCLRAVETVNVKLKRGNILQVVSNFNDHSILHSLCNADDVTLITEIFPT
ncbi:uncharacterized protein LOC118189863 [Stegodyphus dumicola]|uniref:uncharacterized protein LOC118189863 n=1 Tax=Stegodyphus dumicola TaxID=202533 RepID=UPI0015AC2318|nr:uncharacterized protein LOC118189863 [Stegodyphus dumicola]XP_035216445.1 uncharacterized protein LOC118189863 [Stegodyphus dumicola]XP_035216447.1 uncharacterized protein LOC118189863 [Stegodyphus dumicola]